MRLVTLLTLLCISFTANAQTMLTKQEQLKDLEFIYKKLLTNHPKISTAQDSAALTKIYDSTLKLVQAIAPENDAVKLYSYLINSIGCGHTGLNMPNSYYYYKTKTLPIKLRYINDKVYVAFSQEKNLPQGAEVTKINEKTMVQWIQDLSFLNMGVDNAKPQIRMQAILDELTDYKEFLYQNQSHVNIKYKFKDEEKIAAVKFIPRDSTQLVFNNYDENKLFNLFYFLDTSIKTVYINAKNFIDIDDYAEPTQEMVNELKTDSFDNIILDLRGNPGGAIKSSSYLLSYFAKENLFLFDTVCLKQTARKDLYSNLLQALFLKRNEGKFNKKDTWVFIEKKKDITGMFGYVEAKPNNYQKKKVYVLIDESSFSLAPIVAAYFKNNGAILVGTEAGGRGYLNYASIIRQFKLPNSNFSINLPFYKMILNLKDTYDNKNNLLPTYIVPWTVEDLIQKRDPQINKIKELIKASKKQ